MDKRREEDIDAITRLYEASMEGSVVSLTRLVQKDPMILSKISLSTFTETPLHISALAGHLHFTKQLLVLEPKLASEIDSFKRSPLHLASAKGHTEIVQALIEKNEDMCLAKDQEGRIPLHYAAMRGHVDTIEQLLLSSQKRSMIFQVIPDSGETVLHLCVQHNHLEALKVLVKSAGYDNTEFLSLKEHYGGNTILHLAVMLKQIETIKYLLSVSGVKVGVEHSLNHRGLKASDLTELFPRELRTLIIQRLLMDPGSSSSRSQTKKHRSKSSGTILIDTKVDDDQDHDHEHEPKPRSFRGKTRRENCWRKWVEYLKYGRTFSQQTLDSMMVVATVITTMTFQGPISPPGGVWQENITHTENSDFICSKKDICIAGTAVFAYSKQWRDDYELFVACNSASFMASMAVILLLISGVPLRNKFGTWALTMTMCVAVTFMAVTFLQSLLLVSPDETISPTNSIYKWSIYAWYALLGLIALFHTTRLISWAFVIKKLHATQACRSLLSRAGN